MIEKSAFKPEALPIYPSRDTLFTFLVNSVRQYSANDAYVYNAGDEEHRVSYSKLFEDVLLLAKAFRRRGVSHGDKVMVLSDNRYAWIVTDLALMSFGGVNVPRGSDTPSQELQFIVEHSDSCYLVVENDKLLERHADFIKNCRQLRSIFVMAGPATHVLFSNVFSYNDLLSDRHYTQKDIDQFLAVGEKIIPQDLLTIIYTSGTTGTPKGVMLSHANIMHNVQVVPEVIQLSEKDNWLSILPSWHIFERTAEYVALARGTTLVYSSIKTFSQDLEKYKPTLVATVPRVWESLYAKVQMAVKKKGAIAGHLFQMMIWVSSAYRRNKRKALGRMPVFKSSGRIVKYAARTVASVKMALLFPLYKLANKKLAMVRQRFGGRLRLAISGGGTLATHLEEWIDAVGIRIVNAYGMTECSPAIAGRGVSCRTYGTVGPPVPWTELRVVSEEGNVLPAGEEGTIEVRGAQVTKGYYHNEEENHKSFTPDGFFKTGDLGRMTINGELMITGRAKEIIVLSSGENIDPTKIENALTMFPFIQEAILVGHDKKALGALLVPNIEELKEYVAQKMSGLRQETAELLTDVKVLDHIRNDINRILRPKQGFKPYEKLQGIIFLDKEFKLGEELTNTLKKKRHVIEKKYHQIINDLLH
ncbi:long-chain fatty acid--CoA ligase [Desulfopila sp. IMCC35006]|uniref:AMP-dependent synthetase/ligase n=1 Tax=Desulfopila sp. IMCC35006 TaxID=2569542 RepID=UPI0010AD9681|nr:AMP-binding protein [Desulfopila sp. IMCC35006]TKB23640.1 long-chain fatty acid--CoA ligase [Desulfopila sp. IMCC35006]